MTYVKSIYLVINSLGAARVIFSMGHGCVGSEIISMKSNVSFVPFEKPAEPGLYRATMAGNGVTGWFVRDAVKLNAAREVAKLERRVTGSGRRARTGAPGIRGYQERADASAARQSYARSEAKSKLNLIKQFV